MARSREELVAIERELAKKDLSVVAVTEVKYKGLILFRVQHRNHRGTEWTSWGAPSVDGGDSKWWPYRYMAHWQEEKELAQREAKEKP